MFVFPLKRKKNEPLKRHVISTRRKNNSDTMFAVAVDFFRWQNGNQFGSKFEWQFFFLRQQKKSVSTFTRHFVAIFVQKRVIPSRFSKNIHTFSHEKKKQIKIIEKPFDGRAKEKLRKKERIRFLAKWQAKAFNFMWMLWNDGLDSSCVLLLLYLSLFLNCFLW